MNFDQGKTVVLALVKLASGWRVADITYDDKRTLRSRFPAAAPPGGKKKR